MIEENILKITNIKQYVDGEIVYIINCEMEESLSKLEKLANMNRDSYMFSKLLNDILFIRKHNNFSIAFRPVKWINSVKWIPCLLYMYQNEWRRVIIQYANCLYCDWEGIVANPLEPSLYETMNNRFEILKKINQLTFLRCPICGRKISSQAIWTGERDII